MKKTSRIELKVSLQEKKAIEDKAKRMGYKSVSKYIRDVSLGYEIISRVDINAVANLRRIGVNINQLVTLCNQYNNIDMLMSVQNDLQNYMNELRVFAQNIRK